MALFLSNDAATPIPPGPTPAAHRRQSVGASAILYLNGTSVGHVTVTGSDAAWGFGRFRPGRRFVAFAPAYGLWSLMMHADGEDRLSNAAAAELSRIETTLDRIKGRLYFSADGVWAELFQLNIGGDQLEWMEY